MKYIWEIRLSVLLILATAVIYALKILIIGDSGESNTITYIFNALGFLPLNVLLVTLILNGLLTMRAKKQQQEKMKMIIGLFFSECGTELLRLIVSCDDAAENIRKICAVQKDWTKKEYADATAALRAGCSRVMPQADELAQIRALLENKHEFLLRLVENPVLLEESSIAQMMQALFHLGEELSDRDNLSELPATDLAHLAGDVSRVYCPLSLVWMAHMEYLCAHYPYLLSLSLRKSPFLVTADVVVRA